MDNKILASKWHWAAFTTFLLLSLVIYLRRGMVLGTIILVYALFIFAYSRSYVKHNNAQIGR